MRLFVALAAATAFFLGCGCSGNGNNGQMADAGPPPQLTPEEKSAARNKKIGQFLINSVFATASTSADSIEANHRLAQQVKQPGR